MRQFEIGTTQHQSENLELCKKTIYQNQKVDDFTCQIGWNFGEIECIEFIDFHFIEIKLQNIQMKKNLQELHLADDALEFKKKT